MNEDNHFEVIIHRPIEVSKIQVKAPDKTLALQAAEFLLEKDAVDFNKCNSYVINCKPGGPQ